MAKLIGNVASFDITEVAHSAHEFLAIWIVIQSSGSDVSNARNLSRLLRSRRERPRGGAAERGQQLPPSDGDCHTPLPCEVRKGNDTTPRARGLHGSRRAGARHSRCLSSGRSHACCGVVSNGCCDVSAPRGAVFKFSAAPPPPKPAIACTS